jgi:hypothetical protein
MPWDEFNSGIAELDGADVWLRGTRGYMTEAKRRVPDKSKVGRVASGIACQVSNGALRLHTRAAKSSVALRERHALPSFFFLQKSANQNRGIVNLGMTGN